MQGQSHGGASVAPVGYPVQSPAAGVGVEVGHPSGRLESDNGYLMQTHTLLRVVHRAAHRRCPIPVHTIKAMYVLL
ncbi:MAG: hypothetical protein OSB73_21820, partial [Candidatus Latescibacteria bacterium]|nr:hypothetical protein [Candidatus Latescibacterota bacterium]